MPPKNLLFSVVGIAIGILILFISFQQFDKAANTNAKRDAAKARLNIDANEFVNACLKSLPTGSSACTDLRSFVKSSCDAADGSLDVCKDARVEQYYKGISTKADSSSSSQSESTSSISPIASSSFEYQTMIAQQMGSTDFQILNQTTTNDGKILSDIKLGNTIYHDLVTPMPIPDLSSTLLILSTEDYGPLYGNYKIVHNLAIACFPNAYPNEDWLHYTGWKPDLNGNTCHSVGFDTGAFCTDHYKDGPVPADYYYAFSEVYNKDWICNDYVIKTFAGYYGPVESNIPKPAADNSQGIAGSIGKFDDQWTVYLSLESINYGPDGNLKVKILDASSKDLILENEFPVRMNQSIGYSQSGGGVYTRAFPLGISQSDSKMGQVILQLDYTTVTYNKNLTYSTGCDLSSAYSNVCSG